MNNPSTQKFTKRFTEKFTDQFKNTLSQWHLLNHPFYIDWREGKLTMSQLKNYAFQYSFHVDAFPQYVSFVHAQCTDAKSRKDLAHNLADEEGLLGEKPHPELWHDFCIGLGISSDDLKTGTPAVAAQEMVDTFFEAAKSSYAEGLGSLTAYEYQVPEIAVSKIDGLKKFYGITNDDTTRFFAVHREADVYHSQACFDAMEALSKDDQDKALNAAVKSSEKLWAFLSECHAHA